MAEPLEIAALVGGAWAVASAVAAALVGGAVRLAELHEARPVPAR